MSEKALLIAREEILRVIQTNQPQWSYETASQIADQLLEAIEWDNPALMHKSIEWITMLYLNQLVSTTSNE